MPKSFRAFRFNPTLYEQFKELTSKGGYTVTGAFEKLMTICVEREALVFPGVGKVEDVEAEARILLSWLERKKYWLHGSNGKEISVMGRLLQLLSKVRDSSLKKQIEELLKKR